MTRNFYSDNVNRYSKAEDYKDAKGHNRFDLPHAVIMLGFDFGRGWTFGSEIEFEHGGTESAVEMEAEETGEWEKEIERGGEVALEQLWINKEFRPWIQVRAGHMVVPVGSLNSNHLPMSFSRSTVRRARLRFCRALGIRRASACGEITNGCAMR